MPIIETRQFCEHGAPIQFSKLIWSESHGLKCLCVLFFIVFACLRAVCVNQIPILADSWYRYSFSTNPPQNEFFIFCYSASLFKAEVSGRAFASLMWKSYLCSRSLCCSPTGQKPLLQKYALHPVTWPRRQHTPHTREFLADPAPPPLAVRFQPWLQVSARCLFHLYSKTARC